MLIVTSSILNNFFLLVGSSIIFINFSENAFPITANFFNIVLGASEHIFH